MIKKLLLGTLIIFSAFAQSPPVWPLRFAQNFLETWDSTTYKDSGKLYYDSVKQMSKIERGNGKFDPFCSSITGVATPCLQIVREGKRHIIFPLLRLCCFCCDSAHGCGILRRDWLHNAKYVGKDQFDGKTFNKWRDNDADIDYWAHVDQRNTPKKIAQGNKNFKDFEMTTYSQNFPEIVFDLPAFCNPSVDCPASSLCGQFRG